MLRVALGLLSLLAVFNLSSIAAANVKGESFITWDVVTSKPKAAVFSVPDFEGLHHVTPSLYTMPRGDGTNVVVEVVGEGEGFKKVSIVDPDDNVAGSMEAFIDLGDKGRYPYKARAVIPFQHRNGLWKVSLQDVSLVRLTGLAPYFSTSARAFFQPDKPLPGAPND